MRRIAIMSVGLSLLAIGIVGCKKDRATSEAVHAWPPQDIDSTDSTYSTYSSTPAPDPDFVPGKKFYPADKPVVNLNATSSTSWDPGPVPVTSSYDSSSYDSVSSTSYSDSTYASASAPSFGPGSTHTVVKGDTLFGLARSYYNDPRRWRDIYDANRTTLGNNPNVLRVGQSIVIP